jgi:hypothetical protein
MWGTGFLWYFAWAKIPNKPSITARVKNTPRFIRLKIANHVGNKPSITARVKNTPRFIRLKVARQHV